MEYTFASATVLLLLITDPFGNIPIFVNALKNVPAHRRPRVILREVLIAFVILLLFMLAGDRFLRMMSLTDLSLQLAGGIVLFLIALRMIFPTREGVFGPLPDREPFIFPLAVPMLAGPSALATVLLLGAQAPGRTMEWLGALAIATVVSAVVLGAADRLQSALGEPVVAAFERLMGLIVAALAVEMLISGLRILEVIT